MAKRQRQRKRQRKRQHKRHNASQHFSQALHKLKRLKPAQRCEAIKLSNNNFIRQFCAHVKKLKHQKIHPKYQKALASRKATLRKLTNNKVSLKSKRKILSQKGGFLPAILPLMLGLAGPISNIISSAISG